MELTDRIARIPRPRLVEFVGEDVVEALVELGLARKTRHLAQILQDMHGTELFRVPDFLGTLIFQLDAADALQLGEKDEWLDHRWGANARTEELASVLGVAVGDYLPEVGSTDGVDFETVVPDIDVRSMSTDSELADYRMFPLHPYQKLVKDDIVDALLRPDARLLVHMPTGSGKTKTAIEGLVDFWRARGRDTGFIIWLAHTKELCVQAHDTFRAIWRARGDFPLTIAKVFDLHSPDLRQFDSGVAFVGLQKLYSWIQRNDESALYIRGKSRVVVVDEAHMALAPTYERCIEYLVDGSPARLVGLTATPGRGGDASENERFLKYFSDNICGLDVDPDKYESPIQFLQDEGFLARLRRIPLPSEVTFTAEDIADLGIKEVDLPERFLSRLSTNASRNLLIVSEIKKAVIEREDPTLVFATSVQHSALLRVLLHKENIEARCVLGTTLRTDRVNAIADFRAGRLPVLINYNVLTTGFDAPNLGTLVIARPTTSIILYSQMLGRALRGRRMGGRAETNTLVDLVDNNGRFGNEHAAFTHFGGYFDEA
jgi:superfamily II DNA or RNA helicase